MKPIVHILVGLTLVSLSARAGILVDGSLAIKGGPVIDGVKYPSDTIVSLDVRNDTNQEISIPTYNLTVTSQEEGGINLLTISIPESLTDDGVRVPVSRWSLGIVAIPPGKNSNISVRTSTGLNLEVPTRVVLRIDAESSRRYGIVQGDHEVTIPPFVTQGMRSRLEELNEGANAESPEEKKAEPGATDNPDNAQ